jgi:hypothetical protein
MFLINKDAKKTERFRSMLDFFSRFLAFCRFLIDHILQSYRKIKMTNKSVGLWVS